MTVTTTKPLAWILVNASTRAPIGGTSVYIREEAARAMATAMSNRWRTVVAVPVVACQAEPEVAQ
jgi:hypothetical protein